MPRVNLKFNVNPELLKQLAQTGSPVDLAVLKQSNQLAAVEIEQIAGVHDSKVFETEFGVLGFMAYLALTNVTASTIQVTDVELRTHMIGNLFHWLLPTEIESKSGHRYSLYRFPGRCGLEFQADDVLNPVLFDQGMLPGKRRVEGWLLGLGGMMPAGLIHGCWLDASIALIGSDHAEYATELHLYAERLTTRPKRKARRSLFDPAEQGQDHPLVRVRNVPPAPIGEASDGEVPKIRDGHWEGFVPHD